MMNITVKLDVSIETDFQADITMDDIRDLHEGFDPLGNRIAEALKDAIDRDDYSNFELTAVTDDGKEVCKYWGTSDDPGYPNNLDEDINEFLEYLDGEAGLEELENFLGYQIDAGTVETLEDKIFEAYVQMPKEEFDKFFDRYVKNTRI